MAKLLTALIALCLLIAFPAFGQIADVRSEIEKATALDPKDRVFTIVSKCESFTVRGGIICHLLVSDRIPGSRQGMVLQIQDWEGQKVQLGKMTNHEIPPFDPKSRWRKGSEIVVESSRVVSLPTTVRIAHPGKATESLVIHVSIPLEEWKQSSTVDCFGGGGSIQCHQREAQASN